MAVHDEWTVIVRTDQIVLYSTALSFFFFNSESKITTKMDKILVRLYVLFSCRRVTAGLELAHSHQKNIFDFYESQRKCFANEVRQPEKWHCVDI